MATHKDDMTTYILRVVQPHGGPLEVNTYSTAANAIDDLEGLRAGGAVIVAIMHDGQAIDEDTLRGHEETGEAIDAG